MRKNSKKRILTGLAAFSYAFTTASPTALAISESKMVLSQSLADTVKSTIQLPEKFTNIAIGNEGAGNSYYNSELKEFHIEGSGGQIGKDTGKTDSYQLVSHEVKGDAAIVARLKDFDMTNAPYGQAGVILRSDDENNNADYLAVYVEPSKNEYRYAFRDTTKEATGAATLNGLSSDMKDLYIKIVKTGTSFNFYISQNENFDSMLAQGGQTIQAEHDNWNAGFVVGNGNSSDIATATFDNVEITDSTGVIYTTKEVSNDVVEDYKEEAVTEVYLPKKFVDSHIGNNNSIGVSNFIKGDKEFVINGSGNFIGKDTNSTDNYQFVSYEVKGDAYITARLKDFDMTNAKNGQAGVFVRSDNSSNNADYFGVYVEPSKNQYRYAYRDKSAGKSGAAAISGLTADDKDKYIKIEKEGTSFRYSISDDMTFPEDTTLTNTQTVSSSSDTWHFGFVVSNGGSTSSAKAIFDNVKIGTAIGAYYDSTLELRSVETVENLQAIASDAEVNLTWDSVEEADKYIIKRSIQADGE